MSVDLFLIAKRISEAAEILAAGGFPIDGSDFSTQARRDRVCEVFMAICDITPQTPWDKAKYFDDGNHFSLRTRDIIEYLNTHFGRNISSGSYDSIRTKSLKFLVEYGFAAPSRPEAPKSDGTRGYVASPQAGELVKFYGKSKWPLAIQKFKALPKNVGDKERVSVSIVTQGEHKFYTCTISSDILAQCCFVSTRSEDPIKGFQRLLDEKRALDIARYIDEGLGTIPSSIILSAQDEAELKDVGGGKTIEFKKTPRAFLILDGQHRVYGFSKAKSRLRVPVVIYSGLSRRDETRLFIDINSKQKGVPSELLFDIKKLAEYESSFEERMREVYDLFHINTQSALLGVTSPSSKSPGKISRATFNTAAKQLLPLFEEKTAAEFFEVLNNYLVAFKNGMAQLGKEDYFTQNIVFRAIVAFFIPVAAKVQDRYGANYSVDNFWSILENMFKNIKPTKFSSPGNSIAELTSDFKQYLLASFRL